MLFLLKIFRIKKVYFHYLQLKQEEGEIGIRNGIRIGYCFMIIKWEKFLIYRKMRLEKIKENLAVLTVKQYYQINQLTFAQLLRRFKKYKRMLKMNKSSSIQNYKTFDGTSTRECGSVRSDIFTNNSSNENLKNVDNLKKILECASLTSTEYLQREEDRKQKIQNGKIAYNIPKAKEQITVLPYLYQKDILEDISPSCHYTIATSAVVSRMMNSYPKRQRPLKRKPPAPLVIQSPKISPRKIIFTKEHLPNFTRPTISSSITIKVDDDYEKSHTVRTSPRDNTTLFNQTFSGMQRTSVAQQKRSISAYKPQYPINTPKLSTHSRFDNNSRISKYRAKTTTEVDRDEIELPCLVPITSPFTNTLKQRFNIFKN